jgi:hypothetical protein
LILGVAIAFINLISTFTQKLYSPPKKLIFLFLLFNGIPAALTCWGLIKTGTNFIEATLVASIGIPFLLRSRIFTIKIGGEATPIGFEWIYQTFMNYLKKQAKLELDRKLARLPLELYELKKAVEKLKEFIELEKEREEIERQVDHAMYLDEVDQKIALASIILKYGGEKYAEKLTQ